MSCTQPLCRFPHDEGEDSPRMQRIAETSARMLRALEASGLTHDAALHCVMPAIATLYSLGYLDAERALYAPSHGRAN